jgi:ATP-binding cassette subfamily B protein
LKHLNALNKYFKKYKWLLLSGIVFIILSNYFRILSPQVAGYVVDAVQQALQKTTPVTQHKQYDITVNFLVQWLALKNVSISKVVIICSLTLLVLALLGGAFMFLMRQTIIVMSRHIEYEQKNEIFKKYLALDAAFYKENSTGDLMNRISEDVSRVRMYTGPALMYFINLAVTIGLSVYFMLRANATLTMYVLAPLPVLALIIYYVNNIITRKSEKIQQQLSLLTSTAQETYSGIRIIKSFTQEQANINFFKTESEQYRTNAISLAKVEALYFPTMTLLIGMSTLLTIAIGCWYVAVKDTTVTAGTITEFVIYINMLTFPVSAIGWTASMIQRAAVSQKRINEFLHYEPLQYQSVNAKPFLFAPVFFENISFTYTNTGITALKNFNVVINKTDKVLIIGKTGAGKTTIAQLLLKFYKPDEGVIKIGDSNVEDIQTSSLRTNIAYVPQDVFLFSDTIANNICFGLPEKPNKEKIIEVAKLACIHNEIESLPNGYDTLIGERGLTLSGGQKQRISIARALLKNAAVYILDDCLSAVDANTESKMSANLHEFCKDKTLIITAHRIPTNMQFDTIITLQEGEIVEQGNHDSLINNGGYYAKLYNAAKH